MAIEIERKFIVDQRAVELSGFPSTDMTQGYLAEGPVCVRVRLAEKHAYLTLKSTGAGLSRAEFEYEIPLTDAKELLDRPEVLGKLTKTRYEVPHDGFTFEVDVYGGPLAGLVTAEVELPSETTKVRLPDWIQEEISHRRDYSNEYLARYGLPADYPVSAK